MTNNTSVSLGNYFENFVENKIASEVIRAGLRLLEEEESRIIVLKKAIQDGLDSGIAKKFNSDSHLLTLKANKKKHA